MCLFSELTHPGLQLFFGMGAMFWSSPYLLVTGRVTAFARSSTIASLGGVEYEPSPVHLGLAVTLFIFGNWLHHSSDVQVEDCKDKTNLILYCSRNTLSCAPRRVSSRMVCSVDAGLLRSTMTILLLYQEPQLSWRDDDLRLLCLLCPAPPPLVVPLVLSLCGQTLLS